MPIVNLTSFPTFQAINLLADPGVDKGKHPIPNCCDFHIVWNLADGKVGRQILCMSVQGGFAPTAALAEQARAALVTGAAWTTLATFIPTAVSLAAIELRDRRVIDQPLVGSSGAATPGSSASAALPSEVALVLTLRTAKVGQGNRGRAYFGGFATNALGVTDTAAGPFVTALKSWTDQISVAMLAIGGTWALRQPHRNAYTSPKTGAQIPERPAGVALLTGTFIRDNHWDSQRRRGLK